jgi:hypothetical protein
MQFIFEAPLNSLSFGNVAVNLLREMWKAGHDVGLFPVGNPDVSAHSIEPEFAQWLENSIQNRFSFLKKDVPSIKLWHLNGSDNRKTKSQYLVTFYECSEPTSEEQTLVKLQDKTFFSSSYSLDKFSNCDNTELFTLGFDQSFHKTGKTYLPNRIHFGLMGKFEYRKHTAKIIKTWLKKYGNNPNYLLSCCVTNPFFKPEQMQQILAQTLEGKQYSNINFIPYLKTNAEVNDFLNAIDIDLTGLSGCEGWNLPSFNATCLEKWSIVLNATAHKDWADSNNSILVEPNGITPIYDNFFFQKGNSFNQGDMFTWSEEEVVSAMEKAVEKTLKKEKNINGDLLKDKFTYKNTLNQILSKI